MPHPRSQRVRQPLPLQPLPHGTDVQVDPLGDLHPLDDVYQVIHSPSK
ncbi:MAG: hypothetical protein JNM42_18090 [Propionivibrio sp.]|nr:hypothetical protein [Propionivibrio sp.]MBL8416338.1 hypothetical protein [Propionivibrio sp.]